MRIFTFVIPGGASLCTILPLRRRKTFSGSSLDPLEQFRTSRWHQESFWSNLNKAWSQIFKGDPRLADEQVQGLWFCHNDQLRGGSCCHPGGSETQVVASIISKFSISVPQRLHSWQQGSSGLVQNQQQEGLRFQPHWLSGAKCISGFKKWKNCYLAIFSFPRKFYARLQWISREYKSSWILPFHPNMLLILLMLYSLKHHKIYV